MSLDPRTPVLVGVAQIEQRVDDPTQGDEPLEMMIQAVNLAAEDAGSRDLLRRTNSVRVMQGRWRYDNPARAVAERIGAPNAETALSPFGGNMVQSTLNHSARAIQRGDLDVVVLAGAEHGRSISRARKAGIRLPYTPAPGTPDLVLGDDVPMSAKEEQARGILRPIQMYPIFEIAIRNARGESVEAHRVRVSELWSRFNDVAVANPHAWIREPIDAETIRTPSPANRMIGFPYSKLMNSNDAVDQGAALILCSIEAARRAGVSEDRFVFPHVGTDAHDHFLASNRADLHSSPAIRLAGARALEMAGTSPEEIAHVDLYSCFPSAVQVAATELGLDPARPLTVTGGLTFGGGPLNNYVMHSIATMAERLREDRGSRGLVSGNGGFLTKHSMGIYSTEAPEQPFRCAGYGHEDAALQAEIDALPRRESVVDHSGAATLESYTVMFDGDGAAIAHAACLLPDGRRTWANSEDRVLADSMTREEYCGRAISIDGSGCFAVN